MDSEQLTLMLQLVILTLALYLLFAQRATDASTTPNTEGFTSV